MVRTKRRIKTDWANKPRSDRIPPQVVEAIARRRRQMLVHSYLYYRMDSQVIDDTVWTKWAQQLHHLQKKFGWRIEFYDSVFEDWDGSSGYHLPADDDVVRVAQRIEAEHREREYLLS